MIKYDRLKSIIEEVDDLISKGTTSSSPEFKAWKNKTERFLINTYGKESYEFDEFKKMHFSPLVLIGGTEDSEYIEACTNGLKSAKAILNTYLDELKEGSSNNINLYKKLKYEFEGIKSVIIEYTDSGVVQNLLVRLEHGINSKDKQEMFYSLVEIKKWYDSKWDEIQNDGYVHNLDEHERCLRIIDEAIENIDSCNFEVSDLGEISMLNTKEPVIFLSHRSTDKKYGDALERLFSEMGIKREQLIYTSHPLHKIPLDKNIYEYLRDTFGKKIFVIILWSNEYLDSPACLNEMGAVWVTQSDYTNIYVPTFDFKNPKYYQCAVDKNKMGAILDGSSTCKASIIELKKKISELFGLDIDENQWVYCLDQFMKDITV